jgi:lipoprotein-releasing system permease protein
MRVFVWYGLVQGILGTFLGVITGVTVLQYRNHLLKFLNEKFSLELFPKDLYHLSEIPAETSAGDVTLIVVATLVVCVVASSLPALRAAFLDPVKALRYE